MVERSSEDEQITPPAAKRALAKKRVTRTDNTSAASQPRHVPIISSSAQLLLGSSKEGQTGQQQHITHIEHLQEPTTYDSNRHTALLKRRDELLRLKELQERDVRLEDEIRTLEASTRKATLADRSLGPGGAAFGSSGGPGAGSSGGALLAAGEADYGNSPQLRALASRYPLINAEMVHQIVNRKFAKVANIANIIVERHREQKDAEDTDTRSLAQLIKCFLIYSAILIEGRSTEAALDLAKATTVYTTRIIELASS